MFSQKMSQEVTRVLLHLVFFSVLGFSLYLADNVTWAYLLVAILKALMAVLFAWLFFLMLTDSIIKSIMSTVEDLQEDRKKGGLLFHFIKPADNELIPKKTKEKKAKKPKKAKKKDNK